MGISERVCNQKSSTLGYDNMVKSGDTQKNCPEFITSCYYPQYVIPKQ